MGLIGSDEPSGVEEKQEGIQIQPIQQHPELTKWQLDSTDPFEKIIQYLKGYAWVEKGRKGKWKQVLDKPLLNDAGIHRIRTFLYATGNKIQYLSQFDQNEISYSLRELRSELCWHLLVNKEDYDLNRKDIPLLVDIIMQVVHSGIKRSEGGAEKRFITQAGQRITRSTTTGETDRKGGSGGLFSGLFGGG